METAGLGMNKQQFPNHTYTPLRKTDINLPSILFGNAARAGTVMLAGAGHEHCCWLEQQAHL